MKESNTLRNKLAKRYLSANGSLLLPLALKWRLVRVIACSLFAVLVLPCIMGRSASAASITLTIPGRLSFIAATDGQFHESASATVSVKSDAYAGYTLGIKGGESTSPALKNGSYSIASISSAMAGSSFPVNTWGWLPSKLGGQANSQYQPGPTSTLVTIEKTASPNASTANSYTIKLGAKVNGTIPAGTYVNTFTFTATANPVPYHISYNTNGGGTVNATTGSAAEGTQITLASAPTRSNYEFKGWCTVSTSNETCPSTGKSYAAGGQYTLVNDANSFTLYAMWKQTGTPYSITYNLNGGTGGPDPNPQEGITTNMNTSTRDIILDRKRPRKSGYTFLYWCSADNTADPTTCSGDRYSNYDLGEFGSTRYYLINGAVTTLYAVWRKNVDLGSLGDMQAFTCSKISNMGDYGTVRDTRDGNTYRVRLLADGNCWMIDNFRLGDSKLQNRTLTSANTDLNGITSYVLPNNSKDNFKGSDDAQQGVYVVEADSGKELKAYGGYYTFNAATAGTGASTASSANASSSICPKGWKLPNSSDSSLEGDLRNIIRALGEDSVGNEHMTDPDGPNFLLGGEYSSAWPSAQGSTGYYWSSYIPRSGRASQLYIPNSGVNLMISFPYYGTPIRCLAQKLTMQTVNQWGSNVKAGGTAIARDERDGTAYTVRRLADGKLWMIDSLRIGPWYFKNRTFTSADTDLNGITSYTLPDSSNSSGFGQSTAESVYVSTGTYYYELKEYGGYYSWNAATAGTGASVTADGANASSSICPKGWKLPTSADFNALNKALGSITNSDAHLTNRDGLNFFRGGYYYNSANYPSIANRGTDGYYWSSTSHNSATAYYLHFNSSKVEVTTTDSQGDMNRGHGYAIRCVQR